MTAPPVQVVHHGKLLYQAIAKAELLHRSKAPNILYGGAAGGSKSTSIRWHLHMACLDMEGFMALLIRRFSTELEKHHLLLVPRELPRDLGVLNQGQSRVTYGNGSILQFGHCNTEADFSKWLSTEWDMIAVDEAGELTANQLTLLPTRTSRRPGTSGQFILGSNPGGLGHHYLYSHFIGRDVDLEEETAYRPEDYEFIYADFHDNPHIDQVRYHKRLMGLTDAYQRRRFLGDWELPSGNLFEEVEKRWHQDHDPAPWPLSRRVVVGDWGWDAWAPAIWCETDHGLYGPARHRAYREWYPRTTVPAKWAQGVIDRSEGEGITECILDEAAWASPQDGGPSMAEQMQDTFQKAGWRLVPSIKGPGSILQGVMSLHAYFWTAEGRIHPLFSIHDTCKRLWSDVTTVQRGDPLKRQDPDVPVPKQKQLHGVDCLRYFVQSRPRPAGLTIEQRLAYDTQYQMFQQDQRSLDVAMAERAKQLHVPVLKVKDLKVKQRQYPWKRG